MTTATIEPTGLLTDTCARCNTMVSAVDTVQHEDGPLCPFCADTVAHCRSCGKAVPYGETHRLPSVPSIIVCDHCYNTVYAIQTV